MGELFQEIQFFYINSSKFRDLILTFRKRTSSSCFLFTLKLIHKKQKKITLILFVLSWSVVFTHQDQFEIHPNKERFKENWIVDQENVTSLIAKHCPSPRSPDFRPSWTVIGKEIILEKKVEKKNFFIQIFNVHYQFFTIIYSYLPSFTLIFKLSFSLSQHYWDMG